MRVRSGVNAPESIGPLGFSHDISFVVSPRDDPAVTPCRWMADRPDSCSAELAVDGRAESAATALVPPIRPRTASVDGAPLFCLAGEAVLAWNYVDLVAHLDARVPIYGLQASTEPRTIREYATRHLAEIRRIAPHGPYQLLGWSAGGFVAHEVAVRLRAAGEHVRVVLLATDPAAPAPAPLSADRFAAQFGADIDFPAFDPPAASGARTSTPDAAAAAINAATAGTLDLTGSDLDRITDVSLAATGMGAATTLVAAR